MMKDQSTTHDSVVEAKATFFRSLKIWWSLAWRGFLVLMVLGGLFLGATELFEFTFYDRFVAWMDEPDTKNGAGIFIIVLMVLSFFALCFLFTCLLFKLIIGKQYKDFRLAFISVGTPGWRKICRVSLQYFIIVSSIGFVGGRLETLLLNLPFGSGITICLEIFIALFQIYAISFIVNRSYRDVRLSLIKTDMPEQECCVGRF
jgi:hypothetical protein